MARVTADGEKHKIYKKTNKIGEGKPGDIMVNHPTKDKGKWDTINLTKKSGAKTVKQGIASTKKWHKENPKIPRGYHKMPDGTIMKNSLHKKKTGGSTSKMQSGDPKVVSWINDAMRTSKNDYKDADMYAKKRKALIDKYPNALDMKEYAMYSNKIDSLSKEGTKKEIKAGVKPKILREGYKTGGSTPAWTRKEGKNPTGGLNAKGVASYRAANPGSKLKTAVTTKPSKLKAGSKDANRRKSFCARMSGMPGPMKDEKGRPTRKALSLRKWNC
jgi:hypothetical protein